MLSSNIASLVILHPGECYAVAGLSRTDSLALLLTGKCSVLNSQAFLHNIEAGEFLDSPEFESCSEARSFQVTVCAGVTSKYISWQRSKLEYLLGRAPRWKTLSKLVRTHQKYQSKSIQALKMTIRRSLMFSILTPSLSKAAKTGGCDDGLDI